MGENFDDITWAELHDLLRKVRMELERRDDITNIMDLRLSARAYNCLKCSGILTVEDLCRRTGNYLLQNVLNLGKKSLKNIIDRLAWAGHALSDYEEDPDSIDDGEQLSFPTDVDEDDDGYYDIEQFLGKDEEEREKQAAPPRIPAEERLEQLVGLADVKRVVRRIVDYAEVTGLYPKQRENAASLHMLFAGNPGTAKTTVARLIGEMFYEKGVTKNPRVHEVGRQDLVAGYVGHTSPKVSEAFKKAKGGVLFIDEAYSLFDNNRSSFGDEAITTIVQEMENHRDDTIVIFAGYEDKMQELLATNAGLASRVKFHVRFADYDEEEMYRLLEYTSGEYGFALDARVREKVGPFIRAEVMSGESGNGRWIRNAIELAELNWASRVKKLSVGEVADEILTTLIAEDFDEVRGSEKKAPEPKRIGFRCDS